MNYLLFAAADWVNVVVGIVAVVVWIVTNVYRGVSQTAPEPRRPPRQPSPPRPPQQQPRPARPAAQRDLDQFLDELGVKRAPERRPTTLRPQPRARRTPEPAAKVAEPQHQASVSKRHLRSTLEARHKEAIHSTLESKHLASGVGSRQLISKDLSEVADSMARPAPSPAPLEPTALAVMPGGPNDLVRMVMMREILDLPLALRDFRL